MQEIDEEFEDAREYVLDPLRMAAKTIAELNEVASQLNKEVYYG